MCRMATSQQEWTCMFSKTQHHNPFGSSPSITTLLEGHACRQIHTCAFDATNMLSASCTQGAEAISGPPQLAA
jgi:hypothetical protein